MFPGRSKSELAAREDVFILKTQGVTIARIPMKQLVGLILIVSLAACATCKSTDSVEVCRTKERDKSQPHLSFAVARFVTPLFAAHLR